MTTLVYIAAVLIVLGVAQLFAGAGGVEPVCVRAGQVLCGVGTTLFAVAVVF